MEVVAASLDEAAGLTSRTGAGIAQDKCHRPINQNEQWTTADTPLKTWADGLIAEDLFVRIGAQAHEGHGSIAGVFDANDMPRAHSTPHEQGEDMRTQGQEATDNDRREVVHAHE